MLNLQCVAVRGALVKHTWSIRIRLEIQGNSPLAQDLRRPIWVVSTLGALRWDFLNVGLINDVPIPERSAAKRF